MMHQSDLERQQQASSSAGEGHNDMLPPNSNNGVNMANMSRYSYMPPNVNVQPISQQPLAPPPPGLQQPLYPPPGQFQQYRRNWSTNIFECLKDEESCWWGTWCCWVVSARNAEAFGVGLAKDQIYPFIGAMLLIFLLLQVGLGGLGFFVVAIGGIFYAFRRAVYRLNIRDKLNIIGTFFDDFIMHCGCGCCAVCQEAREGNLTNAKALDYCSGQELKDLAPLSDEDLSVMPTNEHFDLQTINAMYTKLSHATQLIVKLWTGFFVYILIRLLLTSPASVGIFLLIFVQPVAILYFVYWRARRRHAQLDYVIKLFAVGFFMATTQSVFFEYALQIVIGFFALIAFAVFNSDGSSMVGSLQSREMAGLFLSALEKASYRDGSTWFQPMNDVFSFAGNWLFASTADNVYHGQVPLYVANHTVQSYADLHNMLDFSSPMGMAAVHPLASNATDDLITSNVSTDVLRKNIILLVIVLFLMAFVVAAGVEETMKHFVVRCCRFPAPLRDPQCVLVYLMSGALGFATAENIEYVFGTKTSPIHGASLFVGELFVLVLRICMPIHVICSVLQAVNLSKVVMGIQPMTIFRIMLPALILHGGFDFFLFLVGALQVVYNIQSTAFDVICFIIPFLITIGGVVYAYYAFKEVSQLHQGNWRPVRLDDDSSVHNVL